MFLLNCAVHLTGKSTRVFTHFNIHKIAFAKHYLVPLVAGNAWTLATGILIFCWGTTFDPSLSTEDEAS